MTPETLSPRFEDLLRELRAEGVGAPGLWPRFLEAGIRLSNASDGVVFCRREAELEPVAWMPNGAGTAAPTPLEAFREFALLAERNGSAAGEGSDSERRAFVATRIEAPEGRALAVIRLAEGSSDAARTTALARLELAAAAAAASQLGDALTAAKRETQTFASILDLAILLDETERFTSAAMLLCNQLAARHGAERVSLGWLRGRYIHLEAISHSDRFEQKSEAATALAAAMEEALDADDEIVFPGEPGTKVPPRFHAEFAAAHGVAHLVSVPLRVASEPQAVITLERATRGFDPAELRSLRLVADHAARRLQHLREHDRWAGARFAAWARARAAGLIGTEHTGAKLIAFAITVLLAVLIFGTKTYRVEAPFTLQSDTVAFLPAPFDGYIEQVHFRIGDHAATGQPLVELTTRELALEEAAALAEQNSFLAEAQKAQSSDSIAEMQIAQAKAEQAHSRLELTRYRLSQAKITAPFDGVVVEGDLRERIGAPVKQGETLLKLGLLTDLFAEAEVNERSIHELSDGASGELAFASRPELRFPVRIQRIEPTATATEKGNNFIVRCQFPGTPETWWRPGMTGLCKLDAGRRSLLWIFTHRTVEFLRLHFWW